MELYVMRHGIAEDAEPGQPDAKRRLTAEGVARVRAVLTLAKRGGLKPSLILSSPYKRALGTAEIAAAELGYGEDIVEAEALVPHGSPEGVWQELRAHGEERSILLTSHEPLAGSLIRFLLGTPELRVEVRKASICRVDLPGWRAGSGRAVPGGVLEWMLIPKISLEENFR